MNGLIRRGHAAVVMCSDLPLGLRSRWPQRAEVEKIAIWPEDERILLLYSPTRNLTS